MYRSLLLTLACSLLLLHGAHADSVMDQAIRTRFGDGQGASWFTDANQVDDSYQLYLRLRNSRLPEHKRFFCADYGSHSIVDRLAPRHDGQQLQNPTISFNNPSGTFHTGLCWMHSRFQRSATYLANFIPDRPKPTHTQAVQMINTLVERSAVVEIPGFYNLGEFTTEYESEITSALNRMATACVLDPTDCASRMGDSLDPSPETVRNTLDTLYTRMSAQPGDIQFVRIRDESTDSRGLNWGSLSSHALLVTSMALAFDPDLSPEIERAARANPTTRLPPIGYDMRVIDSNFPFLVVQVPYRFGQTLLRYNPQGSIIRAASGAYRFVPYLHDRYSGDIPEMKALIAAYCSTSD